MFGGIGPTEIIIVLVIVLVIFGAGKLPEIGSALGKGIRGFKDAANGEEGSDDGLLTGNSSEAEEPPAEEKPGEGS